jgi:hypothetical protein
LALTARLAAELNRLRTTNIDPHTGQPQNQTPNLPPEIPPRLFALPDKQQLVPGALQPQARSDLEGLVRLANDHIAAAMGVPASVVFEGKFSSNSMSQLQVRRPSRPATLRDSLRLATDHFFARSNRCNFRSC